MGIDVEKTAGIISIVRKMSNRELAVLVFFVTAAAAASVYVYTWFEGRYAKLVETQQRIELQQAQLLQLQTQVLTVVNALPAEVRKEIVDRSAAQRALSVDPNKFVKVD